MTLPCAPPTLSLAATVRPASFDDYEAVAAVESAAGLPPKSRLDWQRLWLGNPAYRALPGWPIGWVLEDSRGRIAGSIGNIPFLVHFAGRRYVAASACGWAVLPDARSASIRLLAAQLHQPLVDLHLTTTANVVVSALCSRLGWARPPVGQWDRTAAWVTGFSSLLHGSACARLPVEDCETTVRGAAGPCRLAWSSSFDARFDEFWAELRLRHPQTLLAARDRETLSWHYGRAIQEDRLRILTASRGSRLEAFAVFLRRDSSSHGVSRILLVDWLFLRSDPPLCFAMFRFALQSFRHQRFQVLENPGCWIEQPAFLGSRGPFHRRFRGWSFLYYPPNPGLRAALANPAAWHPTLYDGDAAL